jgi:hypothetical protein
MNEDFNEYLSAALGFGVVRRKRDFRAGNKFATTLETIGNFLRAAPDGQAFLVSLLNHEDPYVRAWAAKDVLYFDPAKAEPILAGIGKMDDMIALSANTTLEEWRARRLFANKR